MTIKIPIEIEGKATGSVGKAFDDTAKAAEGLSGKFTALSTTFLALEKVFDIAKETLKVLAEQVIEYDKATTKLKTTLDIMGIAVEKNFQGIRVFSEEMQKLGGVQDEVVISVVATNVALGLSVKQAEGMTQAAMGLAKAQGVDLKTANEELIQSLNGQVRGLRDVSKEAQSFNKVQLAQGAAIDLIGQKFNKFITADVNTMGGSLERLKISWGDLIKTVGLALFQGFNFSSLNTLLEELTKIVNENREVFVRFGQSMLTAFKGGIYLAEQFLGLIEGIHGGLDTVLGFFGGLFGTAEQKFLRFKDTIIQSFQSIIPFLKKLDSIIGVDIDYGSALNKFQGAPEKPSAAPPAAIPPEGIQAPRAPIGKLSLPLNKQLLDQQLAIQRQIQDEMLSISQIGTNQLTAEYLNRINKLEQMQKDAARDGFNIEQQVTNAKIELAKKYEVKFQEANLQQRIEAAQAGGQTLDAIKYQYDQEIQLLNDKLKNSEILETEYYTAVAEAQRKSEEAGTQTSGTAGGDSFLNKATGLVNSIKGGLPAIISQIGAMFGPIGNLIAGIINLFNMAPEQFHELINGIIAALANLPKYIAQSVPYLIQKIPEVVSALLGQFLSVKFWTDFAYGLWVAIKNMFQNFWKLIFGGQMVSAAQDAQKQVFKGFGADDPNAGDGEFKIKDVDLRNQRRAGTFEDTFKSTVEESGKGLIDYLKEAWNNLIDAAGAFFEKLPGQIWAGFMAFINQMLLWGKKLWDGFTAAVIGAWDWVRSVGAKIWDGLVAAAIKAWDWVKGIGEKIWEGLKAAISDPGLTLSNAGKALWNGFKAGLESIDNFFGNLGTKIWNGLKAGLDGLSTFFTDMFDKLNPANLFKKIFAVDYGGRGTVEKALGIDVPFMSFASGGMVPGQAMVTGDSLANDRVLAYVSPGEAIIPRSLMANPKIYGLVQSILGAPRYGIGGVLGDIGGSLSSGAKSAGGAISDVWKGAAAAGLSPLWDLVMPAVSSGIMKMFSANHFSQGGIIGQPVPSFAGGGLVNSSTPSGAGPAVYNFNFNVSAGANLDRQAIKEAMPQIIDNLRRESRNGTYIIRQNGVR